MITETKNIADIEESVRQGWKALQQSKRDAINAKESAEKELRDSIENAFGVPSPKEIETLRKTHFSNIEDFVSALTKLSSDCDAFLASHANELAVARILLEEWILSQVDALRKILPSMRDADLVTRVTNEASTKELKRRIYDVESYASKVQLFKQELENQVASLRDTLTQLSRKYRSVY